MYGVNIYQDFPSGGFKYLEYVMISADSREEAKEKALEYAREKYKGITVSALNVN